MSNFFVRTGYVLLMIFVFWAGVMHLFTRLIELKGISVDKSGNIFLAFTYNIRKYDDKGKFILQFGKIGKGKGQFYSPLLGGTRGIENIYIDSQNNIYVVDSALCRIQKFDANGQFLLTFGENGNKEGEFNKYTFDIACDNNRDIVVADTLNYRIQRFNSEGKFLSQFKVDHPYSLAIDNENNIYVTARREKVIKVFDKNGKFIQQFGQDIVKSPAGILIDNEGNIFVCDIGDNFQGIKRFAKNGKFLSEFTGFTPNDITLDIDGNILIVDAIENRVLKFDKEGKSLDSEKIQNLNSDLHSYLNKTLKFHIVKTGIIFILGIGMFIFYNRKYGQLYKVVK